MPRNGSGTYNPPASSWNPAVPNQTISSDDWNTLRDDISTAISQSLAIDGQTTASNRIPFAQGVSLASGSLSAPAVNFTADTDTGIYRVGANQLGIVAGGVLGIQVTDTAVTFPIAVTFSGNPSFIGNVTIGDTAGDTLTVNATTTFVGPVTVPDNTITNAKLENVAAPSFKGRVTAGIGDPEDLNPTVATSMLDNVVGDSGSGGTKGLVPAPAAGDAADRKVLLASGGWGSPFIAYGTINGSTGALIRGTGATTAKGGAGEYTVTFSSALANDDYTILLTTYESLGTGGTIVNANVIAKTASAFTFVTTNNTVGSFSAADCDEAFFAVIF